jgi:UV DNA damage endonuclease
VIRRLGYACIALDSGATTNRTCRLANATPGRLRELIAANLDGLAAVLRYNAAHDIRLFRISSVVIPFAGHPVNRVPWWEEFGAELTAIGTFARAQGMRLSTHPGQFTVLSSPREEVVAAALRDLRYHARLLDALGLGAEHKMVLHGGGAYGDRRAAMGRFVSVYHALPEPVRRRLVLENDDTTYTTGDVLAFHGATGVPLVFDALHEAANPTPGGRDRPALLAACFATWGAPDGPPKTHFSTQDATKRPGAHAERIDPGDFRGFVADTGPAAVDCMLEAKAKERALLSLRDALRGSPFGEEAPAAR